METQPRKFNKKYKSIVKPIVRLLKYWNATQGYPYASYYLESAIAKMDFTDDNLENGFFYAIKNLPTYGFPKWVMDKVERLKNNAQIAKQYITRKELTKAKFIFTEMLPGF